MNSISQPHFNMKEIKSIPSLRFKNFFDNWEVSRLNQVSEVIDPHPSHRAPKSEEKGIPFIGIGDISELGEVDYSNVRIVSEDVYEEHYDRYIINKGDVAFGRVASVGKVIELDSCVGKRYTFSPTMAIIKPFKINSSFLKQVLLSKYFLSKVNMKTNGSTRKSIGMNNLRLIEFLIPNKNEQQKIADFLTAVDKRIQLLEKKKTLLETYKKGMMKKIFNQEIRFKDDNGSDFPDWEERKLKDLISDIIDNRGKTPPVSSEGIPLIEVNAIGKKNIDYSKIKKYVDQKTYDSWFRKHLIDNDVLFSTVGQTAICSLYKEITKSCIAQNIVGLRFKNVDQNFMYYLLTEATNNHKFKRIEMGAVQPSVKVSQMIHLKFSLPNVNEQVKISRFLSSLDNQIELLETQIDKSKTWKKGLLQKMFV